MEGQRIDLFNEVLLHIEKKQLYNIRLKSIVAQKKENRLRYNFYCLVLPAPEEFAQIREIVGACSASIPFDISYEHAQDHCLFQDEEKLRAYIQDIARQEKPFLVPVLETGAIRATPRELTLIFAEEHSIDMLRFAGFDAVLRDYFEKNLGEEIRVRCMLDKALAQAVAQRITQKKDAKDAAPEPLEKAPAGPDKAPAARPAKAARKNAAAGRGGVVAGRKITTPPRSILGIDGETGECVIAGSVLSVDTRDTRNGARKIIRFILTDETSSIQCVLFCTQRGEEIAQMLRGDMRFIVQGEAKTDSFTNEACIGVKSINCAPAVRRMDDGEVKRVELHVHTAMSAQDATAGVKDLIRRAIEWGHEAIAITDHGVVQAFPDAEAAAGGKIKVIYGMEAYLVDDTQHVFTGEKRRGFDDAYVVFDLETTGLRPAADAITEIGAVRVENGVVTGRFSTFVDPERPIPLHITRITGITTEMVSGAPKTGEALERFADFAKNACLVAHNAPFDTGFIFRKGGECGVAFTKDVVDTLLLGKRIYRGLSSYGLSALAEHLGIPLQHHRALNDAECTAQIFLDCIARLRERGFADFDDAAGYLQEGVSLRDMDSYHAILLCTNRQGLKNLYRLVSASHLQYFYRRPRVPKTLLQQHREGLLVGTACEQGELFRALIGHAGEETIARIAQEYDYFELQPRGNNAFLIRSGVLKDEKELEALYFRVVELGEKYDKPVAATCDVHFLDEKDECFRRILMSIQKFDDADRQAPLYFRTTAEMLEEFAFLGEDTARRIVVDNTRHIASLVEPISLLPGTPAMPKIEGADEEIRRMAEQRAADIYGSPLPQVVRERLARELDSIISHGFAVLYYIAHKLVKKSVEDGYLVGSRGSVGSSLVAFLTGITEVNPLKPHYVCVHCRYTDFDTDAHGCECGVDLPDRVCPQCGAALKKDGYDIPFEVFLGINADKMPDIDLNFSGEYQPQAHKYTEELFGAQHVYRAGTINSIQEKTAYGFVRAYLEEKNIQANKAEITRLALGISGVKRTTGQHPGGLVVVPQDMDIHDFTPVQHPANDTHSDIVTTHFDFNSLHDTLVKLDILGHDDPTALRMLHDLTGVDPIGIPLNDAATMSLFRSPEALGLAPARILGCETGTIGIPEFGTRFVRQMLTETRPATLTELIRICGLSHGTDVWLNNAQDLVRSKTATLSQAICTRDDIMNYLVKKGMDIRTAFFIMENVRRGRGLDAEMEEAMRACGVPAWFIGSCNKIKYMFPKAHAAAYVIMAFRVAYYKVHFPKEFYAAYFTVRADRFGAQYVLQGAQGVRRIIADIEALGNNANALQKSVLVILEVALEMFERGVHFLPVDLGRSRAREFAIEGGNIRLPFIAVENLGENAAANIVAAREEAPFLSVEDLKRRARLTSAAIDKLENYGCLNGMAKSNQLTLFD